MNNILIIGLGFLAQGLFFARGVAQWFKSEKEGEVTSPVIYWQISLLASLLMFSYGVLRHDFAIVIGQSLVYSIYIRNLQLKNAWNKMHLLVRIASILIPVAYWILLVMSGSFNSILRNKDVTFFWMIWGTIAQIIFISRFFYQWIYSEKEKESVLPLGFWIIGTAGSLMIFSYAVFRLDPVLFAAHAIGLFTYIRNILLHSGKGSLFNKIDNNSGLTKVIGKVSDKIK